MNDYEKFLRKLPKGKMLEIIERKKRELYNLERTLPFLALNPKYDDRSNERAIERLINEIEILNKLFSEN